MRVFGNDPVLITANAGVPVPLATVPFSTEVTVRYVPAPAPSIQIPPRRGIGDNRPRWHRGEDQLRAMRADYEAGVQITRMMRAYRIRSETLHRLAAQHGWERRHAREAVPA